MNVLRILINIINTLEEKVPRLCYRNPIIMYIFSGVMSYSIFLLLPTQQCF